MKRDVTLFSLRVYKRRKIEKNSCLLNMHEIINKLSICLNYMIRKISIIYRKSTIHKIILWVPKACKQRPRHASNVLGMLYNVLNWPRHACKVLVVPHQIEIPLTFYFVSFEVKE